MDSREIQQHTHICFHSHGVTNLDTKNNSANIPIQPILKTLQLHNSLFFSSFPPFLPASRGYHLLQYNEGSNSCYINKSYKLTSASEGLILATILQDKNTLVDENLLGCIKKIPKSLKNETWRKEGVEGYFWWMVGWGFQRSP